MAEDLYLICRGTEAKSTPVQRQYLENIGFRESLIDTADGFAYFGDDELALTAARKLETETYSERSHLTTSRIPDSMEGIDCVVRHCVAEGGKITPGEMVSPNIIVERDTQRFQDTYGNLPRPSK